MGRMTKREFKELTLGQGRNLSLLKDLGTRKGLDFRIINERRMLMLSLGDLIQCLPPVVCLSLWLHCYLVLKRCLVLSSGVTAGRSLQQLGPYFFVWQTWSYP